eukprot:GFKZ01002155.1.p1 GENE.GFKZ01002155.1~~GFKZ01002155.1.p1  ORF type:complete len:282 (-),score=-10.39 GFKZ01002155.1:182-1027(-)
MDPTAAPIAHLDPTAVSVPAYIHCPRLAEKPVRNSPDRINKASRPHWAPGPPFHLFSNRFLILHRGGRVTTSALRLAGRLAAPNRGLPINTNSLTPPVPSPRLSPLSHPSPSSHPTHVPTCSHPTESSTLLPCPTKVLTSYYAHVFSSSENISESATLKSIQQRYPNTHITTCNHVTRTVRDRQSVPCARCVTSPLPPVLMHLNLQTLVSPCLSAASLTRLKFVFACCAFVHSAMLPNHTAPAPKSCSLCPAIQFLSSRCRYYMALAPTLRRFIQSASLSR